MSPGAGARQVPVGVVGQVHHGGLVRSRGVLQLQLVVIVQRVDELDVQRAGIALVTVGTGQREFNGRRVSLWQGSGLPDLFLKAVPAAVDVDLAGVRRQREFDAVDRELGSGDAIGIAAHDRAEQRMPAQIVIEGVQVQRDVRQPAVAVGRLDRRERGPVGHDFDLQPVGVGQRVQVDPRPIRQAAEKRLGHGRGAATSAAPRWSGTEIISPRRTIAAATENRKRGAENWSVMVRWSIRRSLVRSFPGSRRSVRCW